MSDILNKILQTKLVEVEAGIKLTSEKELTEKASQAPICRDFYQALKNKLDNSDNAVIAEVKKGSPSKGIICEDFNPEATAISYEKAGAACLSVLTDQDYFYGHDDYLKLAKQATSLPILRKDFIVSSWQVYHSRVLGADCVLLIVAALSDPQLYELTVLAQDLGMEVLMEVHNEEELKRALNTPARIIGINNRNLRTFVTSLDNSIDLCKQIPKDRIVVSESGIHSSDDISLLNENGINTFLIGEAFMKRKDPGQALRRMLMC
jgi:indole-3-glycerol phosphate synthase